MKRYRVVIAEPSNIIAEGLKSMLSGSEFEVVGTRTSLQRVAEDFTLLKADVVIAGSQAIGSQKQNNIRLTYKELQHTALVILYTTVCDDDLIRQMDGVVNIYDNASQIERKLLSALEQSQTNPYSDSHELSERERDVLVLVANGLANKEIADKLNISIHTVVSHRKNIAHKTGIKSVAGLTVYAMLNNMLDPTDVTLQSL